MKLDILAEVDGNSKINIEFQNGMNYNVVKRGEAYASSIFSSYLNVGDKYVEVPKTIVIWLLDFDLFPDGPYHEQWLAYISHQLNKEELEELFKMNDDIKDIDKIAEMVANSEELRIAIMDKMMAKYERNLEKAESYHEGEKNEKIEIAKKLKNLDIPVEVIIESTGLSKEEIEKL